MATMDLPLVSDVPLVEEHKLNLTPAAQARVRTILQEKDVPGHALRVFVSGGGCSGLQYGMALEGTPRESDHRFDAGGLPVVVDPLSLPYLSGITIDYVEDLMGGGFRIENPNAVASCGCGHSFRTAGEASGGEDASCGCH